MPNATRGLRTMTPNARLITRPTSSERILSCFAGFKPPSSNPLFEYLTQLRVDRALFPFAEFDEQGGLKGRPQSRPEHCGDYVHQNRPGRQADRRVQIGDAE